MRSEQVSFFSHGERLGGDLFLPPDAAAGGDRHPAVVVCHGFGGIKQFFVGDIAAALAAQGFVALSFDYRGFGESDGRRNRLFPLEQVADVRAAVTFLQTRAEVDDRRIAAYGTSFGGGVVIEAAAQDERIGAAVSAVGVGDCERWLRGLRPYWQWREFLRRLQADDVRRVTTGESEVVEPEEIMVRDPESLEHERKLRESYPDRAFQLTLESGEAIRRFKPVEHIGRIAPRAVMLIGIEEDTLCPWDETLDLYARAGEPRRLLALSGLTHHEVYQPQHIYGVLESVAGFLSEHLREP
jgi:alpha-beta hydrolase superfamily lysophospholipase